jgi:hypothetical protein
VGVCVCESFTDVKSLGNRWGSWLSGRSVSLVPAGPTRHRGACAGFGGFQFSMIPPNSVTATSSITAHTRGSGRGRVGGVGGVVGVVGVEGVGGGAGDAGDAGGGSASSTEGLEDADRTPGVRRRWSAG